MSSEDEDKIPVTTRLPRELKRWLGVTAAEQERPIEQVIEDALVLYRRLREKQEA